MTVSAQTPLNRSVGNGVTTVFAYNFKVITEADMEVSVDGVVKTITTDYTLSGVGTDSGNVTFVVPPAADTVVVRRRNMAYTRSVDYQDQGELPTDTLDDDQDAPVLMCQQLAEGLSRAVQVPIDETTDPEDLIDSLLTASAAAVAAAAAAASDADDASDSAAAAAASAASTGLPALTGKALDLLRVKADETGYETRTPAQTLVDIGAAEIPSLTALTSINGGAIAGFRNRIINGSFSVNQRAYVSAAATASGSYMHDRWKSTTANSAYTFTQAPADTTITITAGTIAQVVEDKNVEGGVYKLSWTGTATARVAIDGAATSGVYAASPITTPAATAGQAITVEFSTGTLGKVQLEPGAIASNFERRPYSVELSLCQRYYCAAAGISVYNGTNYHSMMFPVTMRATPTMTFTFGSLTAASVMGFASQYSSSQTFDWTATAEL